METPPILSPNLEIDQNVVPYEDLKIQGSFGRKQTYPNDQVPTISTLLCLDTNDTPRIARSTPSGHIITHPDTSSGGGGGIVPNNTSNTSDQTFGSSIGSDTMTFDCPSTAIITSVGITAVIDPLSGFGDPRVGYGLLVLFLQAERTGGYFELGSEHFFWNPTDHNLTRNKVAMRFHFPFGLSLPELGFEAGDVVDTGFKTSNGPLRLSGYMAWKE